MVILDEYLEIQQLAKQGLSKTEIAQLLGRDQHTVDKYLRAVTGPPVGQILPVGRRVLERFADYIIRRIAQGFTNGKVLLRKIQVQGYEGSYSTVKQFLKPLRDADRWRAEIRWEALPGLYARVDWGYFTAEVPRYSFAFLNHSFTDGYRGPRAYKREEMMHGQLFNEAVVLEVMHCKENKGGM